MYKRLKDKEERLTKWLPVITREHIHQDVLKCLTVFRSVRDCLFYLTFLTNGKRKLISLKNNQSKFSKF